MMMRCLIIAVLALSSEAMSSVKEDPSMTITGNIDAPSADVASPPFVKIRWERVPSDAEIKRIYTNDISSKFDAVVICKMKSDGKLNNCKADASDPNTDNIDALSLTITRYLRVEKKMAEKYVKNDPVISVFISGLNSDGLAVDHEPCLPPNCIRH